MAIYIAVSIDYGNLAAVFFCFAREVRHFDIFLENTLRPITIGEPANSFEQSVPGKSTLISAMDQSKLDYF